MVRTTIRRKSGAYNMSFGCTDLRRRRRSGQGVARSDKVEYACGALVWLGNTQLHVSISWSLVVITRTYRTHKLRSSFLCPLRALPPATRAFGKTIHLSFLRSDGGGEARFWPSLVHCIAYTYCCGCVRSTP